METPPYYDEAYEQGGEPRPHYRAALEALQEHDLTKLGERLRERALDRVGGEDAKLVNMAQGAA